MIRTPVTTLHLGSSDCYITRVGFGAWAIDGSGWAFRWGPQDDRDSIGAILPALMLRDLSDDRTYVFTKYGMVWDAGSRTTEPKRTRWPASMRQESEASLRRLGIERIDLFRFYWPDEPGTRVEELWNTMVRPVDAEKIIAETEIPSSAAHRTGVIWYSPEWCGSFTETLLAPGVARIAAGDAELRSTTVSDVAVAWTLTSRGVAEAILGAGSADQIEGWIDAATLLLSRANPGEIATAIGLAGAGHALQLPAALAA